MDRLVQRTDPNAISLTTGCVIVCVRDPDASNEYWAWTDMLAAAGTPYVYDIDAGYASLEIPEELQDWAESHEAGARRLEQDGWVDAAAFIREIVDAYHERHTPEED